MYSCICRVMSCRVVSCRVVSCVHVHVHVCVCPCVDSNCHPSVGSELHQVRIMSIAISIAMSQTQCGGWTQKIQLFLECGYGNQKKGDILTSQLVCWCVLQLKL